MAYRRNRVEDEEVSYWLSYSDMLAALLLIFVLIITFTMLQSKAQYEEKQQELLVQQEVVAEQQELVAKQQEIMEWQQEQLDRLIGIRAEVVESLQEEFDKTDLKVLVDAKTGTITFDSEVLFDYGRYELKPEGEAFLKEFLPRYFHVLLNSEYRSYIGEIIIEGHTDTQGSYISNLELSQKRALAVAAFCLADESNVLTTMDIHELRALVTANGRSYSTPVYHEDGTINEKASRRVEVKFRLENEEMLKEALKVIEE